MAAIITENLEHIVLNNSLRTLENQALLNLHVHRKVFPLDRRSTSPPTPANSVGENMGCIFRHGCIEEVSSDVTHTISRKNWTSGTTYDEYDQHYWCN